jgi:hypothetical protein
MKTKKKENKFSLEKFEVAKLRNMKAIRGGLGDNPISDPMTTTKNNEPGSSAKCS